MAIDPGSVMAQVIAAVQQAQAVQTTAPTLNPADALISIAAGYVGAHVGEAVKKSDSVPSVTAQTPGRVRAIVAVVNVVCNVGLAWAEGRLGVFDWKAGVLLAAQAVLTQLAAEITYHKTLKPGA